VNARTRIFFGVFVVFICGVAYLLNQVIRDLEPRYRESVEEPLVDMARILAALIGNDIRDGRIDARHFRQGFADLYQRRFIAQVYDLQKTTVDLRVYVTDAHGIVIFDSSHGAEGQDYSRWNDVKLTLAGKYGARTSRNDASDPNSSVLYVAAPISWQDQIIGVLTVCKPTVNMKIFIETARWQIMVAGIMTLASFVVLALLAAVWLVRPYGLIADYARLLRQTRKTSLPRLGRGLFNVFRNATIEMREALAGRSYVEEYVQTLTHEIKSPLSAIRGAAELLQEELPAERRAQFLGNIDNEARRIQDLVDRLLQLAALERQRGLDVVERIDADKLIREVIDDLSPSANRRAVRMRAEGVADLCVVGDRFLLHRALTNLLQNAIDFAPDASEVVMRTHALEGQAVFQVLDSGPGIPAYASNKVLQRFYSLPRPATGKKGTGLGLSFVKEIAELHRGGITVGNRAEGGVIATLSLPLPPGTLRKQERGT
jgi:two-component system, OmpR family, sensor histidine kinase CreC